MERLTRDGVMLAFEDVGRGAPPLLLIHDLGGDHTSLRPLIEHFRRGHRVVAVDLPGHGRSDPLPRTHDPASFADDLAWLCYELGVYRPVALGQGLGGLIAIELAAGYPDLLAAVVGLETPLSPGAIVRLRELSPRVVVESIRLGPPRHGNVADQVNALLDAFLLRLSAPTGPAPRSSRG